jgi:hypothetical protein
MVFGAIPPRKALLVLPLFLAACTPAAPTTSALTLTAEPVTQAAPAPSATAQPTAESPRATPVPPTSTLAPTETPVTEPQGLTEPVIPIGSSASLTETNDLVGVEGEAEVTSENQIVLRDFVYLAPEAPGVDIRLGVGRDFSDEVAVPLKDITGNTYEGRDLKLTIPTTAAGRTFTSIGVFCYATGDLFDFAEINPPE